MRSCVGVLVSVNVAQGVTNGAKTSGFRSSVSAMAEIVFSMKAPVRSHAFLRSSRKISGQRFEVLVVRMDFSPGILE